MDQDNDDYYNIDINIPTSPIIYENYDEKFSLDINLPERELLDPCIFTPFDEQDHIIRQQEILLSSPSKKIKKKPIVFLPFESLQATEITVSNLKKFLQRR